MNKDNKKQTHSRGFRNDGQTRAKIHEMGCYGSESLNLVYQFKVYLGNMGD
jgi:hypothetical protein